MPTNPPRRSYTLGTVVMRTNGITHVKTRVQTPEGDKAKWIAEHRLVVMQRMERELEPGEKVHHLDNTLLGEKGYNDPKNLVVIKCRTTKWKKLTRSRVVYEPKQEKDLPQFRPRTEFAPRPYKVNRPA